MKKNKESHMENLVFLCFREIGLSAVIETALDRKGTTEKKEKKREIDKELHIL